MMSKLENPTEPKKYQCEQKVNIKVEFVGGHPGIENHP